LASLLPWIRMTGPPFWTPSTKVPNRVLAWPIVKVFIKEKMRANWAANK